MVASHEGKIQVASVLVAGGANVNVQSEVSVLLLATCDVYTAIYSTVH